MTIDPTVAREYETLQALAAALVGQLNDLLADPVVRQVDYLEGVISCLADAHQALVRAVERRIEANAAARLVVH